MGLGVYLYSLYTCKLHVSGVKKKGVHLRLFLFSFMLICAVDTHTHTHTHTQNTHNLLYTIPQDNVYIDEMAHFDRERIPERVVHAKGAGESQNLHVHACSYGNKLHVWMLLYILIVYFTVCVCVCVLHD